MFAAIARWIGHRRDLRRRWQNDARRLLEAEESNAYYEAQRRATRFRMRGDKAEYWHWVKVASKVARLSPEAEIVAEEEIRRR